MWCWVSGYGLSLSALGELVCSRVCSTSVWAEPGKVMPPLWSQPALTSHPLGSSGMKHLRGVHANSLTARFLSFDGNKSLCFLESNVTWSTQVLALFKPWLLLITDKALISPHPLPPCSPSSNSPQRKTAVSLSWQNQPWPTPRTYWDRETMQKEWENLGFPLLVLPSLATSSPVLWVRSWAQLTFIFQLQLLSVGQDREAYVSSQSQSRAGRILSDMAVFLYHGYLMAVVFVRGKELFNWSGTYRHLSTCMSCMELFLRSGRTHAPGSWSYRVCSRIAELQLTNAKTLGSRSDPNSL